MWDRIIDRCKFLTSRLIWTGNRSCSNMTLITKIIFDCDLSLLFTNTSACYLDRLDIYYLLSLYYCCIITYYWQLYTITNILNIIYIERSFQIFRTITQKGFRDAPLLHRVVVISPLAKDSQNIFPVCDCIYYGHACLCCMSIHIKLYSRVYNLSLLNFTSLPIALISPRNTM